MANNYSSIAPFPLESLTTAEFAWLAEEGWEDSQIQYFNQQRSPIVDRSLTMPSFMRPRARKVKTFVGRWVLLTATKRECVSWAEVHGFQSGFRTNHVYLGPLKDGLSWKQPSLRKALAHFLSSILVASEGDRILLHGIGNSENDLKELNWGQERIVSHFKSGILSDANLNLSDSQVFCIESYEWWQNPDGQSAREGVSYLSRRLNQGPAKSLGNHTKRRRSFFGLLGRK